MAQTVFHDLHRVFPDRIVNMTNGVTPRRWLYNCNPSLSGLITETIGDNWVGDLERLPNSDHTRMTAPFARDLRRPSARTRISWLSIS